MRCRPGRNFTNYSITIRWRKSGWVLTIDHLSARISLLTWTKEMSTEAKPEYSPGLAGVIAGETAICWVDPNAGRMYRGYDIHEMAEKASFEEVAYLLLNGELPDVEQLNKFTSEIARARMLPKEVLDALRLMPKETHPMDMLRTGVSMLGAFDPELNDHSHAANIRKSIRLIGKVPTLITDGYRIAHGED